MNAIFHITKNSKQSLDFLIYSRDPARAPNGSQWCHLPGPGTPDAKIQDLKHPHTETGAPTRKQSDPYFPIYQFTNSLIHAIHPTPK